jgi:integrase
MGRDGSGITARKTSIQIAFTHEGKHHRLTLKAEGKPVPPTLANIKRAERLAAEIRDRIRLGAFVFAEFFPDEAGQDISSLSAYLMGWEKTLRAPASTKAKYSSAAKFWRQEMGEKPLHSIKPSDIRAALANRPNLAGKTVNDYVSVLRMALQAAVDDRLIQSNPAEPIEAAQAQAKPPDPFTAEEAEEIISALKKKCPEDGDLAEFRFFTGLRTGELIGLRWENVDLRAKRMLVVGGRVRGEDRKSTKTGKTRVVDLNSRAMAVLKRQRARTQTAGAHVFLNPRTGVFYDNENQFAKQAWAPCLKALSMRYRRPYNTRHTYATMMLMAGLTPAYCAAQLGHSVEMFLKTYAKWLNGDRNALEQSKLEQFLGAGVIPGAIVGDQAGPRGAPSQEKTPHGPAQTQPS